MRAIFERDFVQFAALKRYFVMRSLVVLLPLVLLMLAASEFQSAISDDVGWTVFRTTFYPALLFLLLITPALTAHVLTEERLNNRLDVLRTAPLSAFALVCGRWLARVATLLSVVVASMALPSLSLLFGGPSPESLLRAFIVLVVTVIGLSALAMMVGASTRSTTVALRLSYGAALFLMIVPQFVSLFAFARGKASLGFFGLILSLNPFTAAATVEQFGRRGGVGATFGVELLVAFVISWTLMAAAALGVATWLIVREPAERGRKRRVGPPLPVPHALPGTVGADPSVARPAPKPAPSRPDSGDEAMMRNPLLWLETGSASRVRRPVRLAITIVTLLVLELLFITTFADMRSKTYAQTEFLHIPPMVMCLVLAFLSVASAGAASSHRDAEANTRDVLFTTPIASVEIARAKLAGARRAGRRWIILGLCHALFGVIVGDLNVLAVCCAAAIAGVLIYTLSGFAVRYGMTAKSSTRANMRVMGFVVGYLFVWPLFAGFLGANTGGSGAMTILLGHHPIWISALPWIVAENGMRKETELWVLPLFYLVGYLVFGVMLNRDSVPSLVDDIREDRWTG